MIKKEKKVVVKESKKAVKSKCDISLDISKGFKSSPEKHKRRRITKAIENINLSGTAKKSEKLPAVKLDNSLSKVDLSSNQISKNSEQQNESGIKKGRGFIEELVQMPQNLNNKKNRPSPSLEADTVENLEEDVRNTRTEKKDNTEKGQEIYGLPIESTYEPVRYMSPNSPDYETAARTQRDLYVPKPRENIVSPGRDDFAMRAIREPSMELRGQVRASVNRDLSDSETWKSPTPIEKWESPDSKKYYSPLDRKEDKKKW
jgi:hypothetical protein